MRNVGKEELDNLLTTENVVLVDFFAMWCGPCKMLMPTMEKVAAEFDGKVTIVKVNIDDEPDLAHRYGVQSIPTLIYFKNGKEINRSVGMVVRNDIAASLNVLL